MAKEPDLTRAEKLHRAVFGKLPEKKEGCLLTEAAKKEADEKLRKKLEAVLQELTHREREVIKLRYGLGDGHAYTLEEVKRIFEITRERVRQIEKKAIEKLQHPVRAKLLDITKEKSEKPQTEEPQRE